MDEGRLMGLVAVAIGVFSFAAGFYRWRWFFNMRRVRRLANWFGEGPVAGFYLALGVAAFTFGLLLVTGVVEPPE